MGSMQKLVGIAKQKWQQLRAIYSDSPHKSFRPTPRVKRRYQVKKGAAQAWLLIVESALLIWQQRRIFVWLMALYAAITYVLVGGISQIDYVALRESSADFIDGLDAVTTAAAYFGAALTGGLTEAPNEVQRILAGLTALLFWLVTIWAARMILAGNTIKLRDAFYNGPTPFISTVVLLIVVAVQLIPAAIGLFAFSVASTEGWLVTAVEGIVFGAAAVLLCLLSLYWVTGSVVATAVVALPGMYPLHAFANARMLVMGKRWDIATRIFAALFVQFLLWAAVLLPLFMLDNWLKFEWLPLVPVAVQLMSGFSIVFTSVYLYKLYRSLLA
jgi:hypothetical protein